MCLVSSISILCGFIFTELDFEDSEEKQAQIRRQILKKYKERVEAAVKPVALIQRKNDLKNIIKVRG